MDLYGLKQNLKVNKIDGLYVFYGPEATIIDAYVERISQACGKPIKRADAVVDIARNLKSNNIFNTNYVYVIREDRNYVSTPKAWEIIQNNKSNNIIILIYNTLDKRTKFFDSHKNVAVEFERLSPEVLLKHVMKDYGLSEKNATRLVNRCDSDYGKIKLVGDKLKILSQVENRPIDIIFSSAVEDNLIPMSNTNLTFDFLDAVIDADIDKVWFLLKALEDSSEPNIKLIGMLYTNIKNVLLVQSCDPKSNIQAKTGLDNWIINKTKNHTGIFPTSTLVNALGYIRASEKGLKTGEIEDEISLENLLVNLFFDYIFN